MNRTLMATPGFLRRSIDAVPDLSTVPTYQQMVASTRETLERHPGFVTVTRVGVSGQGEPIDMISIGDGPRSALLVDAPIRTRWSDAS